MESEGQKNHDWIKLEDTVLYTTYDAFFFLQHSFYFRMLKNLIDNLIPTGVMKHMIENFYTKNWKFEKSKAGPQILKVDDLLFGFKIWFVSCLISSIAILCELFVRLIFKDKAKATKVTFAKIHPIECENLNEYEQTEVDERLVAKFRVQRKENKIVNLVPQVGGSNAKIYHQKQLLTVIDLC
jgi:hypothetical protein